MEHRILIEEVQTGWGIEHDLIIASTDFCARFPLPRTVQASSVEQLPSHPPLVSLLELWGRTRRGAVESLYTTAFLIASMALEVAGKGGDERLLQQTCDGSLRRASITLADSVGTAGPATKS